MDATAPDHTTATTESGPTAFETTAVDEWEYEYDENESEDLYFTLDVTTLQLQSGSKSTQTGKGKISTQPNNQLQVLELQSDNPLIKFGECFYSCRWSTDLGTQFYLAKPGIDENPLRRGHVLDVIGTSRVRLTGDPVTLHRRRPDAPEKAVGSTAADAIRLDEDEDGTSAVSTPPTIPTAGDRVMRKNINRLTTARQNARDPLVKAQASFLERLAIIKHKKGEKDVVPVYGVDTIPTSTASNATGSNSVGKRKPAANDAHDGPSASNSAKKLLISPPFGESGANGDQQTSQIQPRWSNNGTEALTTTPESSRVNPQLHLGETAPVSTEAGATRASVQSLDEEDLDHASSNHATYSRDAGADDVAFAEQSRNQP